jgi:exopolyphosphatase/guanosine-5'-triphosphate,3'-diphosphate pyrophosphatase
MSQPAPTQSIDGNDSPPPRLVAVIDVGSISIRMQIAEIDDQGKIRNLEAFSHAVSLGKESFRKGHIPGKTIEDCVQVLTLYRTILQEFGITNPQQIRVVATSAVRAASNRMAFVDRIYIATEFEIEPFEEAELHRAIYFAISSLLKLESRHFQGETLVIEVGGGTSEVLVLEKENVSFARTYSLGALRLRNDIHQIEATPAQARGLMEAEIRRTLKQFRINCPNANFGNHVAIGGDVRFAAQKLAEATSDQPLVAIDLPSFKEFLDQIWKITPEEIATRYHMSLPDAQTLGPALLTHYLFACETGVEQLLIANVNLRDGLLKEMAEGRTWSEAIQQQIVRSAILIGRKFQFEESHALHVSELACQIFDQLQVLHQLPERFRGILQIAAILHDIGSFVSIQSRHKHSQYLIQNSDLFGIGKSDIELISQVARYHRRAFPQPTHLTFAGLSRDRRVAVSKLAALLRLAKALDVSMSQRIRSVESRIQESSVFLLAAEVSDVSVEKLELRKSSPLFESLFGKRIVLESTEEI